MKDFYRCTPCSLFLDPPLKHLSLKHPLQQLHQQEHKQISDKIKKKKTTSNRSCFGRRCFDEASTIELASLARGHVVGILGEEIRKEVCKPMQRKKKNKWTESNIKKKKKNVLFCKYERVFFAELSLVAIEQAFERCFCTIIQRLSCRWINSFFPSYSSLTWQRISELHRVVQRLVVELTPRHFLHNLIINNNNQAKTK